MMHDAIEAAPFTAEHMDALYLDDYADLATARLARHPLDEEVMEALEALEWDNRRLFLGARYMLAATARHEQRLDELDALVHQAVMLDYLDALIWEILMEARIHLIETVAMSLGRWCDGRDEERSFATQVAQQRAAGSFRPLGGVARDDTPGWLAGEAHGTFVPRVNRTPGEVQPSGDAPRRGARARGAGRPAARSSAASGDGGSDSDGDPPDSPGDHRPVWHWELTPGERQEVADALEDLELFVAQYREMGEREMFDMGESAFELSELCDQLFQRMLDRSSRFKGPGS